VECPRIVSMDVDVVWLLGTIAASVTWASWGYGSPAPLARVSTELDLMPAMRGYPHSFGWVRTELPYQL
jgi:hypothetical protein